MTALIRPKAASATVSFGTTEQVVEEAINKMYDPHTCHVVPVMRISLE
jgi:hypothetical protein